MVTAPRGDRHQPPCAVLRRLILWGWCLLIGFGAVMPATADDGTVAEAVARAAQAARAGNAAVAADAWSAAERQAAAAGDAAARMEALLGRAEAYQTLGLFNRAAADLEACRTLSKQVGDPRRLAIASGMLGALDLAIGDFKAAERLLSESLALTERHSLPAARATALADLGLLRTVEQRPAEALAFFDRSLAAADRLDDPALLATVQINRARAALAARRPDTAAAALDGAGAVLAQLEPTPEKARLLVARAATLLRLQERAGRSEPRRVRAIDDALRAAETIAARLDDRRTLAFAYGYLGRLEESQRRDDAALELTRQAVHFAQQTGDPAILYQWHWQTGRLLQARGETARAIEAYQRAVGSLREIRYSLGRAPDALGGGFREMVMPLYQELADLLLKRAATRSGEAAQADLRAVRNTMEQVKSAELEDYFRDDCVASLQAKQVGLDRLPERAAALYPILLPDRTELILTIGNRLQQITVPVGVDEMTAAVREVRRLLEEVTTREYVPAAERLYDLLIRPIAPVLEANAIDTLVFVPDGPLRTIPIAALYDGHHFVAERFATVVVPGLTLLDPKPLPREQISVLLNALTLGVQGYAPLPHVAEEVETVEGLFDSEVLENQEFVSRNFQRALAKRPFRVVHIASHGEFSPEAEDSYILTYDSRLSMNQLESFIKLSRFREIPIDLLILSACETATGDDRAALGLAGVAIKAGARSAVASLWFINDEAAAALVSEFYRQLEDETISKAEALRRAQISLIGDRRYQHPGYWSPFLLIGNWF